MTILGKLNDATPDEWDKTNKVRLDAIKDGMAVAGGLCPPTHGLARNNQVGGSHYKDSNHQPLEIVLDTEGYEAFRGACLTKVYKYLQRKKNDRTQDYKKAQHILNWLVEETEKIDIEERKYEKDNGFY